MKIIPVNSYKIKLEFASKSERQVIESAVSYDDPGAKFSPAWNSGVWDGKKSFLSKADYMSLGTFKSIFPNNGIQHIPLFR